MLNILLLNIQRPPPPFRVIFVEVTSICGCCSAWSAFTGGAEYPVIGAFEVFLYALFAVTDLSGIIPGRRGGRPFGIIA